MLLQRILNATIRKGDLRLTDWNGVDHSFGDGTAPAVHVRIATAAAARTIALDPDIGLGECYMDGSFDMISGTIYDFLALAMGNIAGGRPHWLHHAVHATRRLTRRLRQHNAIAQAKVNVAHHYDLSGQLYDLFLDEDRQYSCAYFAEADMTLAEAQKAKKRHIAAKLNIKPGMRVLDIGSGWGGLGIYLAEMCGADVTGVTLSAEQHALSNQRAKARGLEDRVRFLFKDYRHLTDSYDRIVSVGMFEHVGVGYYDAFFTKVSSLLKADGIAMLHSINRSDGPGVTSAWISKYIFPGGYVPALSEVLPHMERHGLYVTDIEILRLHYAQTLRHWSQRFAANRDKARALYDERFCRMWEFYLAGSECAFRFDGMNNFQIQFCKDQHALPLTRNYITEVEEQLHKAEARLAPRKHAQ